MFIYKGLLHYVAIDTASFGRYFNEEKRAPGLKLGN